MLCMLHTESRSALGLVGSAGITKVKCKQLYKNSSINHSHSGRECPDRDEPGVLHPFEITLAVYTRNNFSLDSRWSITKVKHEHFTKTYIMHVTKLQLLSYPVFIKGSHNHQFQEAPAHMLHSVLQWYYLLQLQRHMTWLAIHLQAATVKIKQLN